MKKFNLIFVVLLFSITMHAQTPHAFNYQAVVRDNAGSSMTNQNVFLRISILRGSTTGTVVYVETHSVITNPFGLVSFSIGSGTVVYGIFANIPWSDGEYFLKTELNTTEGTNYQLMGITQLISVPFALNAANAHALTLTDQNGNVYQVGVDSLGNLKTTPVNPWQLPCGEPIYDIRDDHIYNTVQIGTQCWMKENLAYLPGVSSPTSGSSTSPYYYVHGYNGTNVSEAKATANYQTYGVLYNWTSALAACPQGWHLPSDSEWDVLVSFLGGSDVAGGKMKEADTAHWSSPNTGATNESGFTGLPGGIRGGSAVFAYLGTNAYWWSSAAYSGNAWSYDLSYNNTTAGKSNAWWKQNGFSVRCLRDN